MKILPVLCACICLLLPRLGAAEEVAVSDASLKELLEVTESRKLLDGMAAQLDSVMQTSLANATAGKNVTAEEQAILDDMRAEMVGLMKEQLSWSSFEPIVMDIYRRTFTEGEVQGMLEFYRSPAGRAVIAKMPQVTEATVQSMLVWMGPMQQKMQALQQRTVERLREARAQ
jgi:hypothetical protein